MRGYLKIGVVMCAVAGGVLMSPVAAGAAPTSAKSAQLINIMCDNGIHGQIVSNGNGDWTPGHLVGSNTVLIPVAFGASTFTAYAADGSKVLEGSDPAQTGHAPGRAQQDLVDCTYSSGLINVVGQPDTPPGAVSIEFAGSVTVAIAGGSHK
ncbi:MAG: hypothetical protein JWN20_2795 [Jatrophihabitantaceae bacterium]|nr:hypothetical protein [Jatrophihabitantaceae bacterium]